MRPQIALETVLEQASAFLGQPLGEGRAAELGADHLVVFASSPALGRVVIKVGEDAETDAYVLDRLRDLPVLVPRPLEPVMHFGLGRCYSPALCERAGAG